MTRPRRSRSRVLACLQSMRPISLLAVVDLATTGLAQAPDMTVARVWKKNGIQPHRMERYMASTDPDFETKAADVSGLYLHPPQHAVVFCVDEKTAIQALDRKDPILPLSPGRAERHGFEYFRHGTLSLYAALNTQSGIVFGQTAERHTSQAFVAFLAELLTTVPKKFEVHIICDNLSAHKTKRVEEFLAAHPRVHLHFTPTYSSWLNQLRAVPGLRDPKVETVLLVSFTRFNQRTVTHAFGDEESAGRASGRSSLGAQQAGLADRAF